MQHEHIFPYGEDVIKITASIWVDNIRQEFGYNHHVSYKRKREKKFKDVDDLHYGELEKAGLNHLIATTKQRLWEKLKP